MALSSASSWRKLSGAVFAVLALATAVRADISTTFDTGLDGWYGDPNQGPTSQYSWGAAGGNPGGYFDFIDQASTSGTIDAPNPYLGNWSALNGTGTLKWDQILFSTGPEPESYGFDAYISGPGGSATFSSSTNDSVVGTWITISAPMAQADWSVTGSWTSLLADVTSLQLSIENVTNDISPTVQDPGDHDGIDNIHLVGQTANVGVPEPSSLILAGLGVVGGVFRHRWGLKNSKPKP